MIQTIFTNLLNTINNSKFLAMTISVIITIAFISLVVYVIRLLSNIRMYIVNKSNSFYLSNLKNKMYDDATLSIPDRIELTNSILDLISFMINNEIITHLKQCVMLDIKYEITNLDTDVTEISNNVFKGINKKIFKDPNLILTEEYLMTFITKKTISIMLDFVMTHNEKIRSLNQNTRE